MKKPRLAKNGNYYNIVLGNKKILYLGTIENIAKKFGVNLQELCLKEPLTPENNPTPDDINKLAEEVLRDEKFI
jgi:hypothetical protein